MLKIKNKYVNNLSEIDKIRILLEDYNNRNLFSDEILFKLNLVIEELFTNIVSYGFSDNNEHLIELITNIENNKFTAVLIDDGIAFDPLQKEDPDLEVSLDERKIGGLGIHLMKSLMNEFYYERVDNKNILTIIKNLY
jgi:anti-sigma regulatory factor (Ser/Thr protein kinase)